MKHFILYLILLSVFFPLAPLRAAETRHFLFQSVMSVNGLRIIPNETPKSRVILSVPPKCTSCLTEALRYASMIEKNYSQSHEVTVIMITSWEKAREIIKQNNIDIPKQAQDLLFVDTGGRFARALGLEKSGFAYLKPDASLIHKGVLKSQMTEATLYQLLKISTAVKK